MFFFSNNGKGAGFGCSILALTHHIKTGHQTYIYKSIVDAKIKNLVGKRHHSNGAFPYELRVYY
jgi:hypothetical protein